MSIIQGTWAPYVQHKLEKYPNLTECPCGYLDRFSGHGGAIRAAYEKAVVDAIGTVALARDIRLAVIGSGGLLQESRWLTQLFIRKVDINSLDLHVIDTDYTGEVPASVGALGKYVKECLPSLKVSITPWNSCETLAAKKFKFHLVIGMDTEHATSDAKRYNWQLLSGGDLEKLIIVRWNLTQHDQPIIEVNSRRGSDKQIETNHFSIDKYVDAAKRIEQSALIG